MTHIEMTLKLVSEARNRLESQAALHRGHRRNALLDAADEIGAILAELEKTFGTSWANT